MAHREALDLHTPPPCVLEPLDPIRRKNENHVEIEGAVFELDEVFPSLDLCGLIVRQREAQVAQGDNEGAGVLRRTIDEEIRVLRGVWKSQQDRARLSEGYETASD